MNPIKSQRGYLFEVPLILSAVLIVLVVIVPRLPGMAGVLVAVIAAVLAIAALYYVIVAPGWQPGARQARGKATAVTRFLLLSSAIVFAVAARLLGWGT